MNSKRYEYLMRLDRNPSKYENVKGKHHKKLIKENLTIAEEAINDFHLTDIEAQEVRYLLKRTPNIRIFYKGYATREKIIYAIVLLIRKKHRSNTYFIRLKPYNDKGLNKDFLLMVSLNMSTYYQKSTPYWDLTTSPDHDLLCRTGDTSFIKD